MERTVRRADIADVAVLVQLRTEMFAAMGSEHLHDREWQTAAHRWFVNHLTDAGVCIVAVEVEGRVVASAMGAIRDSAPSPSCPSGGDILISNVATVPNARRQGHAGAALGAVMDWARSTGVPRAELMATGDGISLYRNAGFVPTRYPAMRAPLRDTF